MSCPLGRSLLSRVTLFIVLCAGSGSAEVGAGGGGLLVGTFQSRVAAADVGWGRRHVDGVVAAS